MDRRVPSVLFVCAGNSCRSVMAEALAKRRLEGLAEVRSAGLNPQPQRDSLGAMRTLEDQFGIVVTGHRPRHVRDADIESFDYVVAMDAAIGAALAGITRRPIITWNVDDPWGGDQAKYRECALEISYRLSSLLAQLTASEGRSSPAGSKCIT